VTEDPKEQKESGPSEKKKRHSRTRTLTKEGESECSQKKKGLVRRGKIKHQKRKGGNREGQLEALNEGKKL